MRTKVLILSLIIGILCIALLIPLIPKPKTTVITLTGSTLAFPVVDAWSAEFGKKNPQVKPIASSTGSGMGIAQAMEGAVDIGVSDLHLLKEKHAHAIKELVQIPIFIGAVAITYNVPEVGNEMLRFSADLLAKIWMGKVTYWDDEEIRKLNPEVRLPHKPIIVLYRSDSSGTTFLFTSWLALHSQDWAREVGYGTKVRWPTGIGADGNQGVVALLETKPYSIAYVGFAWAEARNLPLAAVLNPTSNTYVVPSLANIKSAGEQTLKIEGEDGASPLFDQPNSYPISGYSYFLVKKDQSKLDPDKSHWLKEFLLWTISDEGQSIVPKFGYAPLPGNVAKEAERRIRFEIEWPKGS